MKKFSTFPKFMTELEKNPECMNDIKIETNGKFRKISKSSIENIIKYLLGKPTVPPETPPLNITT